MGNHSSSSSEEDSAAHEVQGARPQAGREEAQVLHDNHSTYWGLSIPMNVDISDANVHQIMDSQFPQAIKVEVKGSKMRGRCAMAYFHSKDACLAAHHKTRAQELDCTYVEPKTPTNELYLEFGSRESVVSEDELRRMLRDAGFGVTFVEIFPAAMVAEVLFESTKDAECAKAVGVLISKNVLIGKWVVNPDLRVVVDLTAAGEVDISSLTGAIAMLAGLASGIKMKSDGCFATATCLNLRLLAQALETGATIMVDFTSFPLLLQRAEMEKALTIQVRSPRLLAMLKPDGNGIQQAAQSRSLCVVARDGALFVRGQPVDVLVFSREIRPQFLVTSYYEQALPPHTLPRLKGKIRPINRFRQIQEDVLANKQAWVELTSSKLILETQPGEDLATVLLYVKQQLAKLGCKKSIEVTEHFAKYWTKTKQSSKYPEISVYFRANIMTIKGASPEDVDAAFHLASNLKRTFKSENVDIFAPRDVIMAFVAKTIRTQAPNVLCSIQQTVSGVTPVRLLGPAKDVSVAMDMLVAASKVEPELLPERVAMYFPHTFLKEMYKFGVAIINNKARQEVRLQAFERSNYEQAKQKAQNYIETFATTSLSGEVLRDIDFRFLLTAYTKEKIEEMAAGTTMKWLGRSPWFEITGPFPDVYRTMESINNLLKDSTSEELPLPARPFTFEEEDIFRNSLRDGFEGSNFVIDIDFRGKRISVVGIDVKTRMRKLAAALDTFDPVEEILPLADAGVCDRLVQTCDRLVRSRAPKPKKLLHVYIRGPPISEGQEYCIIDNKPVTKDEVPSGVKQMKPDFAAVLMVLSTSFTIGVRDIKTGKIEKVSAVSVRGAERIVGTCVVQCSWDSSDYRLFEAGQEGCVLHDMAGSDVYAYVSRSPPGVRVLASNKAFLDAFKAKLVAWSKRNDISFRQIDCTTFRGMEQAWRGYAATRQADIDAHLASEGVQSSWNLQNKANPRLDVNTTETKFEELMVHLTRVVFAISKRIEKWIISLSVEEVGVLKYHEKRIADVAADCGLELSFVLKKSSNEPKGIMREVVDSSGVKIQIRCGTITNDSDLSAIVNAANKNLEHGGGVARVIADAAGERFLSECRALLKKTGVLQDGDCVRTGAGSLDCDSVLHAVAPVYHSVTPDNAKALLRRAFGQVMKVCSLQKIPSVALPLIGSGLFGNPHELCIQTLFEAVEANCAEVAAGRSPLKHIRITIVDESVLTQLCQEFDRRYPVDRNPTVRKAAFPTAHRSRAPVEKYQFYYLDGGFVPYDADSNCIVNSALQSGGKKIRVHIHISLSKQGTHYEIDFDAKNQKNLKSGFVRDLMWKENEDTRGPRSRDEPEPAEPEEASNDKFEMAVSGLNDQIDNNISVLKRAIKGMISRDYMDVSRLFINDTRIAKLNNALKTQEVYVSVSYQSASRELVFQGVSSELSRAKLVVYESGILNAGTMTSPPPLTWQSQSEDCELFVVAVGSEEWMKVEAKMRATIPAIQLHQIQRIQNRQLWDYFSYQRGRTSKPDVTKELFHGTRTTKPEVIFKSKDGFAVQLSGAGMWGRGTYFAEKAAYSHAYASTQGATKQMMLCEVAVGDCIHIMPNDSSLALPPLKADRIARYDSVSGDTGGSVVFIVYENGRSCPHYLVTYTLY